MSEATRQRNATLRLLPVLAAVLCTAVVAACNDQQVPTCESGVHNGRQLEGDASGRRLHQAKAKNDASERLWNAAVIGDVDAAQLAIDEGADLESRHGPFKNTPIIAASREGHDQVVELLVNKTADVNATADDGESSLFLAAQFGHTDVVSALIAGGADVNIMRRTYSDSPLFIASQNEHREIVEMLIDKGADVNKLDLDLNSALHIAAEKGNDAIVQALLGADANVSQANQQGVAPLHLACAGKEGAVVQALLGAEAAVDVRANDGSTPLMWAAWFGNLDAAKVLMENGARRALQEGDLATVLEQVCQCLQAQPIDRPDDKLLQCPDNTCEDDAGDLEQLRDVLQNGGSDEAGPAPEG